MATPSTPVARLSQTVVSDSPTGTWRHPKFDEIAKRQNAARFNDQNVKMALMNVGAIIASFVGPSMVGDVIPWKAVPAIAEPYTQYAMWIIRLIFVLNVAMAFKPLYGRKDDLLDIPLTPSQRALLGLKPSPAPATPGTQFITPPRYARSATPKSSGRGGSRSPASRDGSPLGRGSPFSSSGSPLLHRAVGGGRRGSYSNTPASLDRGIDSGSLGFPSTPTPTVGKGASVGLNNRWLYERGRQSPGSRALYS